MKHIPLLTLALLAAGVAAAQAPAPHKEGIEGKDYIMHDADVCHFLFNV